MGGRYKLYETPEAFEAAAYEYLEGTKTPTIAGLCLAMGISRSALSLYSKREEFRDSVLLIKQSIEAEVEFQMLYGKNNVAGQIFWLKNNADYKDVQQTENTHNVRFVLSDKPLSEEEWEQQQNG